MPLYRFRWSNLPAPLLEELCEALLQNYEEMDHADALRSVYRARP